MKIVKDYEISEKTLIQKANGQLLYNMYIVTLIYSDGSRKEIKVFADINSVDISRKSLVEGFIINRLSGKNGLIAKEGRDDYIFLGKLTENDKGHYTPSRTYMVEGTNKNAQQYFDENILPLLKKQFNTSQIGNTDATKSKIYSEIKSPFEDENTIQQLVELYASGNITSADSLYNQIAYFDSRNENNRQRHYEEFHRNVLLPNFTELYNNMSLGRDTSIPNEPRVKNIFSRFETYEELYSYIAQNHTRDIYSIYKDFLMFQDENLKKKYADQLRQFGLTTEELDFRIMVGWLENTLFNKFDGGEGLMGFHVNPQNLKSANIQPNKENPEMKFYINAGYDTYRFARYFQEKCNQNNLNYYFKVVNPLRGEHERSDKLCIYTELKNADIFLQLIKDIKIEHPDIMYRRPPLLAGSIQDFIGVGTDNISNGESSYNHEMSKICFSTMENIFKGMSKNDILLAIKRNPSLLQKIKAMITSQATTLGLSSEKVCIREDSIQKLRDAELQKQNKQPQSDSR